ncbi:hypothetical protein RHGRI_006325 [Rhododendron griersonianum]|uniref:Disease resistance protein At4g27190-like leucine-rich repeats domain-containing protein n=1 Tax=Rhododendron griersonianum TaxID=479676 RepID=A0AAV6KTP5_9ERIC|nr:hypothetical protein RHGRI_006325 [Rhododendron griersonianum]
MDLRASLDPIVIQSQSKILSMVGVAASLALEVEHLEMVGVSKITEIRDKQPLVPEPKKEVESLCKLMDIRIEKCGQLLYVFPSHMLPQNLQQLFIEECDELEVIFSKELKEKEAINNDIIGFPQLKAVTLKTLRKLKSFYTEMQGCFFSHKVIFPVLDNLTIDGLGNIIKIWDKQSIAHVLEEQGSFCQLKSVNVQKCAKLIHVFPSNMHPQLKNLERLEVTECETMKGIAEFEGEIDEDGLRNEVDASLALEVEHLEMVGVPKITEIRDKQPLLEPKKEVESLCKLMDIHIKKCGQLLYVFPSHMLPQNLQELLVVSCNKLEVIFLKDPKEEKEAINNDIIVFPQLKAVTLKTLRKLKSFYTETQGSFFSHKVIFPVMRSLTIDGLGNIIKIWDKQSVAIWQEQGFFCQLTKVDVNNCEKLTHVFPSNMHPLLNNLEWLSVNSCATMKGIAEFEGEIHEDGLRNEVAASLALEVEHLEMVGVSKITEIRDKQPLVPEPKKEVESLCKLMDIRIEKCGQLLYVFPSHMLPQNLQQLFIEECDELEVIFSKELKEKEAINNDIIGFPQLKAVTLKTLRKLKSFYTETQGCFFSHKVIFPVLDSLTIDGLGNIIKIWDKQSIAHVLEEQGSFCQLKSMNVQKCAKLIHVFPSNMHPQLKNLERLQVEECETMKGIAEFEGEIDEDGLRNEVAASLALEVEHLEMVGVPKITEIRDKQPLPKPKKEVESLCKLMDIRIWNCGQLLYVFPPHMLPQNLQKLWIQDCDELEVILSKDLKEEKEAINEDIIVFPRLKEVRLWALRKLKSFYTETQGFFFPHKVVFPVLQYMWFWNLDKITRIWDDQPLSEPEKEAKSFSELVFIIVDGCNQLEYVLPSYMLPQLKNLQQLSIESCTKVEVIISNNPKEKEATNNNDTIRFPQLKTLKLSSLPNLKSFICSDETQSIFSNKVAFPVLKRLDFINLDKITRIWDNQPLSEPEKEAKSFCELMGIIVDGCNQLEYVLPFYILPRLKNLQYLLINTCRKMEVIISNNLKEKEATNNNDTIRFPQLKTLKLSSLPNLKSFICSDETQSIFSNKDAFPVLEKIYLDEDLEFLRNETSTKEEWSTSNEESDYNDEQFDEDLETPMKEVSMEECSTSGKENDHNGEELDEDLETPTKKVSMEFALEVTGAFGLLGRHARARWSSLLHPSAKLVPFNKLKTHLMMMLSLFGL